MSALAVNLLPYVQNINFDVPARPDYVKFLYEPFVNIQCTDGEHKLGSSRVEFVDKAEHRRQFRYYPGRVVAAHIGGKIYAYSIKGIIKILHQDSNIKGGSIRIRKHIVDLSFSYSTQNIILGIIDCEATLYIYQIDQLASEITEELKFKFLFEIAEGDLTARVCDYKICWSPSFSASADDTRLEMFEKRFAVLIGWRAEIYDYESTVGDCIKIIGNSNVVDVSFLLQKNFHVIALAYQDGYVKLFQLFLADLGFKKVYEFKPHGGKFLSSIHFPDNHMNYSKSASPLAITGANYNSELKFWCRQNWTCWQTIRFLSNPNSFVPDIYLNVSIDNKGHYMIISDVNKRGIYILQLQKPSHFQIVWVAHFLVSEPILGCLLLEAAPKNIENHFNFEISDPVFKNTIETNFRLLVIEPKKFRECSINFKPVMLAFESYASLEEVERVAEVESGEAEPVAEAEEAEGVDSVAEAKD